MQQAARRLAAAATSVSAACSSTHASHAGLASRVSGNAADLANSTCTVNLEIPATAAKVACLRSSRQRSFSTAAVARKSSQVLKCSLCSGDVTQ